MNRQRGIIWLTLLPYILGAAAVIGAAAIGYQYIDERWETDAGVRAGIKKATDELQPKLTACEGSLTAQNEAISRLEAAGKAKVAAATKGLAAEKVRAKGLEDEAKRLRGLAGSQQAPSACPAGEAVKAIRQGLRAS